MFEVMLGEVAPSIGYRLGAGVPWRNQNGFNNTAIANASWVEGTPLPGPTHFSAAFITKNKAFLTGGRAVSGGSSTDLIYSAPIDSGGTIGTWTVYGNLPYVSDSHRMVVLKNRVYMFGGGVSASTYKQVNFAQIDSNGDIGPWVRLTDLPVTSKVSNLVVTRKRIYLVGAWEASTVVSAEINNDGSLGTWIVHSALPFTFSNGTVITIKDKAFFMGGLVDNARSDKIYSMDILPNGTLANWKLDSTLFQVNEAGVACVTNNAVYDIGGLNATAFQQTVYAANIVNGKPALPWLGYNQLPAALQASDVIITSSKLYMLGGRTTGSVILNKTYYRPFSGGRNDYSEFYSI